MDGAGLEWTRDRETGGNGPGLAEGLGIGTENGLVSDEGPDNCAGLRNGPSNGMFAYDGAELNDGRGFGTVKESTTARGGTKN